MNGCGAINGYEHATGIKLFCYLLSTTKHYKALDLRVANVFGSSYGRANYFCKY